MVSDETYSICLPILQDASLDDEDKTDKLEELLKEKTSLTGQALDNAILDALWRYREGGGHATSPPPIRQTILRRPSPASWRGSPTPLSGSPRLGVSPLAPPGFLPSALSRNKSSTAASPFGSPRPSPRLAFATPAIPHSPSLNAYQFANDDTPSQEIFGDYQSDNVDWLVSDDAASVASSVGASNGLSVAAPEFVPSGQVDMTPYDILRSILGPSRTDEEIDGALAVHGYDLGATITAIMDTQIQDNFAAAAQAEEAQTILIGKSISPEGRPSTPADQQKSGVICKFFLSTGQCLRADCRFSHDLSNHICKYWVAGNCLAGNTCIFSHDPAHLVKGLQIDGSSTPPTQKANIQIQDYNSFPALQPGTPESVPAFPASIGYPSGGIAAPPGFKGMHAYGSERPRSRPGSRHQNQRESPAAPPLDDADAFPSLGSAAAKQGKKHHGKRGGHGHGPKEPFTPSTLADIVKMSPSPSPGPGPLRPGSKLGRNGSSTSIRNGENSAAAQAIPSPKHIPWLETGERANKSYLKARQEAIKHGGLRNKFLQSAAQAWNRNDARAAKALSLRGQSENDLMRKAHREAAKELYEERNRNNGNGQEIYVDLHGLHPEEAVEYLERVLLENSKEPRPIYAITGTGHHSKNGKDKVGKALRNFLNEWRYAYREFSVPGDRNNMGGILGIDGRSWDKTLVRDGSARKKEEEAKEEVDILDQGVEIGEGKVKLLVRDTSGTGKEPPKGPAGHRLR
ncbi:hypothetical protein CONLIGDRAFT_567834 [Coniochaeta ligniaria NRRL 30616]|uniref:CCCH zinc finger and SMR domain-containing protein n=1 Tax=Coniochaeta ligniaria NRRL 30616 TaxID=1408157 RepID=A0A1J7J508_9PEZI|nr:hypothetical protein CONLIGDRAFT_567834 [Coniochaeta ligniaria NRRL 30616]